MDVVFLGTPGFAVPALRALVACGRHRVVGVVTRPDRPQGRGRKRAPPAVKTAAQEAGLALLQTEDVNGPEALEWIRARAPRAGVVVAFGPFLKKRLREIPPLGLVNLHASLLPRYRGAAPVHAAIRNGDRETGVSVMRVEGRLDAGPVLARAALAIGPDESAGELEARLAVLGGPLVVGVLDRLAAGTAVAEPQDEAAATHAGRITPEERWVPWQRPAAEVHNHVRGLTPHPGAISWFEPAEGERFRVRITRTALRAGGEEPGRAEAAEAAAPGTVLGAEGAGLRVAAGGGGGLIVLRLVPAGGREMLGDEFLRGRARLGGRFARKQSDDQAASTE